MKAPVSKAPVSVVILTLNERERMQRCLHSVRGFEQVIVVDSLSSDGTLDCARELWNTWSESDQALTLVSRSWPGFTKARNQSLNWVRCPWVLWLDADEWVSEELFRFCVQLPRESLPRVVYELPRQSFFLGRKIRYGGWYPDYKRRLAPSQGALWKRGPQNSDVHEDLTLTNAVSFERLPGLHIFHEGFRDEKEQRETNELYSTLLAQGLSQKWIREKKLPPSRLYILFKGILKFLENYFFKLGFLDGIPGFKIALGSAWSMKQRLLKAKDLYFKELR